MHFEINTHRKRNWVNKFIVHFSLRLAVKKDTKGFPEIRNHCRGTKKPWRHRGGEGKWGGADVYPHHRRGHPRRGRSKKIALWGPKKIGGKQKHRQVPPPCAAALGCLQNDKRGGILQCVNVK